ncbi:unnamed protein product, partial [Chrysoparadoxa australica]
RAQEVAKVVERDFVQVRLTATFYCPHDSTPAQCYLLPLQGKYLITGDITESIYRPDCQFTDPTTNVHGVKKYTDAVKVLFDGNSSSLKLLSKPEVSSDGKEVTAQWELSGYLKFPWHPYVKPYTGTTVFTLDEKGLISSHAETWSISALDAALATITPTPGPGKE